MRQHPTDDALNAFLGGALPSDERRAVLLHLSRDCPGCRRRLARLSVRALGLSTAAASRAPLPASAYDAVLDRAFATVRQQERALASEGEAGWARVEELLARSYELRFRDPAGMVRFAEQARLAVSRLQPERYGAAPVADLEARVHAELANAHRVAEDLPAAESAIALAEELREEGTGDPALKARLLELTAAVRREQRRFAEASGLLRRAQAIYEGIGERHLAGRTLVSRSLCLSVDDTSGSALGFLSAAVDRIDPARDPKLLAMAEQNICSLLVEARQFLAARQRLARGDLQRALADEPLGLVRLDWLEGRIALGLGYPKQAAATLREVRGVFLEAGRIQDADLVALDLAAARFGPPRGTEPQARVGP